MNLVHRCVYCSSDIFKVTQDFCWTSPLGKHSWRVQSQSNSEDKEINKFKKEIIYS